VHSLGLRRESLTITLGRGISQPISMIADRNPRISRVGSTIMERPWLLSPDDGRTRLCTRAQRPPSSTPGCLCPGSHPTETERRPPQDIPSKRSAESARPHGWDECANWHLGLDDEASEHTKARYKFPYGDFARVHRCGVLSAEVRAGRNNYRDIEAAAVQLRDMMDDLSH
jgi:hypothetical protein